MNGIKKRLILTLRFIYDISFIHLLLTFVTYLIIIALENGYLFPNYSLLSKWLDILIIYKNEFNLFYHALFIFVYNYIDWLLTGKYHIFPKLVYKLIKGRISLILKTFVTLLILLYLIALFVGMYITNQEEKEAEELRIAKEIQLKKEKKAAEEERIAKEIQLKKEKKAAEEERIAKEIQRKREAEEARIAKEIQLKKDLEKEQQERENKLKQIQFERNYNKTYPYQGLSCKHIKRNSNAYAKEDIVLILKRNKAKDRLEVDFRTSDEVLDGVIYGFSTYPNNSIKVTATEIKFGSYTLSRSSLKLKDPTWDNYQCRQVDYKDLYGFVKKHNASITDKNKL